jgi:hypothetical protein
MGNKIKIGPEINISKGSSEPVPGKVTVDTESRYYGIKGELGFGSEDNNIKISGKAGKGSGRADVKHPFGKDTFKGSGPMEWNVGIKWSKKFSRGGGVAIQGTKFNGVK